MFDNEPSELMRRFNDAFRFHDPAALEPLVADDCVDREHAARARRLAPRGARPRAWPSGRVSRPRRARSSSSKRSSSRASAR